jgi:predicted alpha-1,2-mannosidase
LESSARPGLGGALGFLRWLGGVNMSVLSGPRRDLCRIAIDLLTSVGPRLIGAALIGLLMGIAPPVAAGGELAAAADPQPGKLGGWVDPFIGTGGVAVLCGNNFPGATLPFGMVRLSPDTVTQFGGKATNMSGYYYDDRYLLGFSHTRLVGTGAIDGGNFLVTPAVAPLTTDNLTQPERLSFTHELERAFPGYYAVQLPDLDGRAELTATRRVGVHRYTFAEGQTPHLRLHVSSALGRGRAAECQVRMLDGALEIEGTARTFGSFSSRWGGAQTYFVARLNYPIASYAIWQDRQRQLDVAEAEGEPLVVDLAFAPQPSGTAIELKLALSYVSIEGARANLEAETEGADFDQLLARAVQEWEQQLGLARIDGGTDDQRTIFYTALYRALNMPTEFSDVDGRYIGFDKQIHQAHDFRYYSDMSLWDTFRTTHPLYTLILPGHQRDMLRSLVEMARQGGYLPRWPSGSGYTNSMFGTPADFVVAESYLKGIRDFDVQLAYEAIKRTALAPTSAGSKFSGRVGIEHYLQYQYCPYDLVPQSVSKTLEFSYADYAIARLAEALGHTDEAAMFDRHALFYRNLWNSETAYFQPRDSRGAFFADFRPLMLTYADFTRSYTTAYVEGSALHWRWAVPHDPEGLISLFPSREAFVEQLEDFFHNSPPEVGVLPTAYYWHGNQPDLFAPFLFNSAGRPDLTQKWSRWVLEHKYGTGPGGLDGNDDGGTLSAWYVFASLGLYPLAGTDRYELTSPLWSRAVLAVGDRPLVIVAEPTGPEQIYVRRVLLNGQPINGYQLRHAQLVEGGELRFEMSEKPLR